MNEDDTQVATGPTATSAADAAAAIAELPRSDRYRVGATLATGGMGEVLVAHDVALARDVVIKRMRTAKPSSDSITRFLREARIQGRLQHPAIVPVHELAVDASGRPFFAMKQLPGQTLLDAINHERLTGEAKFGRPQLLRAFVEVCLAVELAHTRNVIHRDLKPGNIALGDFGEVYVLDWGIARILGDDHPDTLDGLFPAIHTGEGEHDDWQLLVEKGMTVPGTVLGTPGYMSPEQLKSPSDIGPGADIYALGCILFELLALDPLHARSGPLASTVQGVDARPSRRSPARDISPELDEICVRATAVHVGDRYATARALGEVVQRYLDGDRDHVRRKELADRHLEEARNALALTDDRAAAVRAAGRALALDPGSVEAATLISELVLEAPATVPEALRDEVDRKDIADARAHSRFTVLGVGAYAAFLPMLLLVGVRDWSFIIFAYVLVAANIAFFVFATRSKRPPKYRAWIGVLGSALMVGVFARLVGPFILPQGLATAGIAVGATNPFLMKRGWLLVLIFLTAALAPWGLELVGVLTPTYRVLPDGFLLFSNALDVNPIPGQLAIAGYIASVVAISGILMLRIARVDRDLRIRLEVQAWHLRHLVPVKRRS